MTTGRQPLAGIAPDVEQVVASVSELGAVLERLAAAAGRPLRSDDLVELRSHIAKVLRRYEGFAAGAGVVLAPGALSDAPRWLEWWWADRGEGLDRLEVDLDPDSAEFYDYTTTEWYREPERTGEPAIAGPYVDYICTRRYTFTLSVPVVHAGRFLGVAGADILAEEVERAVLPELARLEHVAVLASASGRVIASNAASLAPGVVLARQEQGRDLVPVDEVRGMAASTALPWLLLRGGPVAARV